MNYLRRIYLSILGRPLKSLLLLFIVFLLSSLVGGAFLIKSSTERLSESIETRLGALMTIRTSIDSPKNPLYNPGSVIKNGIYDELKEILENAKEIPGVVNVDFRTWPSLNNLYPKGFPSMRYYGVSSEYFNDRLGGYFEVTDGRSFTQEEIDQGTPVALISDQIIYDNDGKLIEIGSEVPFALNDISSSYEDYDNFLERDFDIQRKVEIIGKFSMQVQLTNTHISSTYEPGNLLLMPSSFLQDLRNHLFEVEKQESNYYRENNSEVGSLSLDIVRIYLKDKDSTEAVTEILENMLSKTQFNESDYRIVTSSEEIDKVIGPVSNINRLGSIILVFGIFATIMILSLVIFLFLRERQKEIGIYVSLGEYFYKIVAQFTFETLVISMVAIMLSFLTSGQLAKQLTNQMMDIQNTSDAAIDVSLGSNLSQDIVLEEYKVEVMMSDRLWIITIVMMSILASSVLPIIYISKLEPKKVLM